MAKTVELWDVLDADGNKTGRFHERGKWLNPGDYHLVVHVWIKNSRGEFLISKRTPNKIFPNLWECTGGSAVAGDDSITAAMREVREELGIVLEPTSGRLFKHHKKDFCGICGIGDGSGHFVDVWLFCHEMDIGEVVLQPNETCDAMWASEAQIRQLIDDEAFVPPEKCFPYLDELFREVL